MCWVLSSDMHDVLMSVSSKVVDLLVATFSGQKYLLGQFLLPSEGLHMIKRLLGVFITLQLYDVNL